MQKSSVSQPAIEQFLQQRLGVITNLHQLTEGLASQAYGFQHDDADYVIRIKRWMGGFEKDAFVSRTFLSASLPIPEVVTVDRFNDDLAFCISRRAPGVRLQDLNAADVGRMVGELAQILETIAAADLCGTAGFGRFDASGTAPFPNWKEFLTGMDDSRSCDWRAIAPRLDMPLVDHLLRGVRALAEHCPEERRLIHGDFGSYNVLTDGSQVTAVIDWDLALFGDPLYDVASLFFWEEKQLEPIIQHFKGCLSDVPGAKERVTCYQLRIGLQELFDSASGGAFDSIEWLTTRCMDLLNQTTFSME